MRFLIINGPNLNLLGIREPKVYGKGTYKELCGMITAHGEKIGVDTDIFQSNHEGAIVDRIQEALGVYDGIVINPAAYTHYSIAICDALKAVMIPYVEVHISDISKREAFRQVSYVSEGAVKTVSGIGFEGYTEAMSILKKHITEVM